MNVDNNPLTFSINLTPSIRQFAQKQSQHQTNPQKAQQVYWDVLATYAVNFYCQCMGIKTDWTLEKMPVRNDPSELTLKNLGRLKCVPIFSDVPKISNLSLNFKNAMGAILVQLNPSCTEATLLGFTRAIAPQEMPSFQMLSLEALLDFVEPVNLSQWFEKHFEKGWERIEALMSPLTQQLTVSFRRPRIAGTKSIALSTLVPLELVLAIAVLRDREVDIELQVRSYDRKPLPQGLRLFVIDESGETFSDIATPTEDGLLCDRFCGEVGEQFTVKLELGDKSFAENFVI